jgi:hypothetical protein
MSRAGRLVLWGEGPTVAAASQGALPRPRPGPGRPASADPGDQRRHHLRPPARLRQHHHVPGVPGAGAHHRLRGPGALHHGGDARATEPAEQGPAGAVHHHQRHHRGAQVHPHDPGRQAHQGPPHLALVLRPVPRPPGHRWRPDPQRGQPRGRGPRPQRRPDQGRVRPRLPHHARPRPVDVHRPLSGVRHPGLRGQVLHAAAAGRRAEHQLHRHRQPQHRAPAR